MNDIDGSPIVILSESEARVAYYALLSISNNDPLQPDEKRLFNKLARDLSLEGYNE